MTQQRSSPRVLWVTEEPPDFADKGGSIRQAHLLRALADRLTVDLLLTRELRDSAVRDVVRQVIQRRAIPSPWPRSAALRRALTVGIAAGSRLPTASYPVLGDRIALHRALRHLAPGYDLVCVEHESLAPVRSATRHTRWVITFHHVLSQMIEHELVQMEPGRQRWLHELDRLKARRLEARALRDYDRAIACSEIDASLLTGLGVAGPQPAVIPNGVDLDAIRPTPLASEPTVLFPGSFDYAPNVDGARWLCTEVWPRVRDAHPAAQLVIAGRRPVAEVRDLDRYDGVSVRADVPSMAAELAAARVVAVPLRVGTGTRLKALEAMASGRPVVGTPIGLAGIGVRDGEIARVAEDPGDFAEAIGELLTNDAAAERLATAARAHVEAAFDWRAIGRAFADLLAGLLVDGQPSSAAR